MELSEHKNILAFLDTMLREAAGEELDLEADAIIRAYFKRHPEAAYRITKRAMQEAGCPDRAPTPPTTVSPTKSWIRLLFW